MTASANRSTPRFVSALAAAAVLSCAASAHAQVAFDANLELDTLYVDEIDAPATNARDSDLTLAGRIEVNATTPLSGSGSFVKARASLLTKKDGDAAVDDLWVQFGNASTDLKLGRFEAMDLFPLGKDVLLELNVGGYEAYRAQFLRGRFGSDAFHGALGINAGPNLRFELGLVQTKEDGLAKGFRPAVAWTTGALTLRAGVEAVKIVGQTENENGAGVSASYQFGKDSVLHTSFAKRGDDKSVGMNAIVGPAGFGFVHGKGATDAQKVTTLYASYSFPLMGVKGAFITPALSVAKGAAGTDNQLAAKVRINYAF